MQTYTKASDALKDEMDLTKLIYRVRRHEIVLQASSLCSKERNRMIDHTKECIVDVDTSESDGTRKAVKRRSEKYQVKDSSLDISDVEHGACRENEDLITVNIQQRIIEDSATCMCGKMP